MASGNHALALYQDLADWYEQRGQAQMRDRFLVLAADAALSASRPEEAERLRVRLLQQNPHHLLKPYASFVEALQAPDVQSYVSDLRRSYSPDAARHLLESLRANPSLPNPPPAPIRQTALHPRPPEPAKEPPEVLKFYRVQEEIEEVVPEPVAQRQVPVSRPLPKPLANPPPPSRPATAPVHSPAPAPARKPPRPHPVPPAVSEPLPPVTRTAILSEKDEQDLATGFWVSSALMVLLFLAGLGLAIYTFARPFLPEDWFR
jgi:hypothetical protein